MKISATLFLLVFTSTAIAQNQYNPTFEEVISLQSVFSATLSPDGQHVLFSQRTVDWEENRYDTELWLSKNKQAPFQLTNNPDGSSNSARWSPDGQWIAFLSNRGEKNQIHIIRTAGGEAFPLTSSKTGVQSFKWSPDGTQIAFRETEDSSSKTDQREKKYGSYAVDDDEYQLSRLRIIDFEPGRLSYLPTPQQMEDSVYKARFEPQKLLDSVDFTINDFDWSPDGKKMVIEHQPNPLINSFFNADLSILDLDSETLQPLINNPSYDGFLDWSPDGDAILYTSSLEDTTSNYYMNNRIFRIDIDGSNNEELADEFDEDIYQLDWSPTGIYGLAWQKTTRKIVKINAENGKAEVLNTGVARVYNISVSESGQQIAFSGADDESLSEIYTSGINLKNPSSITRSTDQIKDWAFAKSEVVQWASSDGATIEGVLHKPMDYDPARKYPLMVMIHGGPTGISRPSPVPSSLYPSIQWLNKGALVLQPNYRGSAGYGEDFRALNVKNLGVGDAWDVLSGVKYLEDEGLIHGDSVGCMGWSQGGYISAFLTTNSDQFQAISVGAGISNWMTYYVNTDIHPFTRQYLKATPWSDKEIYEKTSPMTNINNASTPTLIQHGEFDRRVPPANAYELAQGLRDVGVDSKLIIYKGFGHGISKPKERLAAAWHNWEWFARYLWGEQVEIPME